MNNQDYRTKFKTTGEVLKNLFDDSKKGGVVSDQFLRWKLWLTWKDVVGASIAEYTEPVSYNNGTLWIWVKNAAWMQQMTFMADVILNTIEHKYRKGYVKELRFTLDRRGIPADDSNFKKSVGKFLK